MKNKSKDSSQYGTCPNPLCKWHHKINLPKNDKWFRCHGYYDTKQHGRIPRYICINCHRTFTLRTSADIWHLKDDDMNLKDIGRRWIEGSTICEIAKSYGVSDQVIRTRLKRFMEYSKSHWDYASIG